MRPNPLGVLLLLSFSASPQLQAAEAGLPVATTQLYQAPSYAVRQQFAGLVESAQQSTLAFTTSAPLAAMAVDAGDFVTEGKPWRASTIGSWPPPSARRRRPSALRKRSTRRSGPSLNWPS